MNLLKRWLKHKLWRMIAVRFFHLREIESFLYRTGERYIDVAGWATMRGISNQKSHQQLLEGVRLGYLEKCFLYEWPDVPIRFVLPASYIGRTIRLADTGYIGEDDYREFEISQNRVREVFIAAGN